MQTSAIKRIFLSPPHMGGQELGFVKQALEKENIESRPVWKPMHMQPVFKGAPMRGGSVCEDLFNRGLCLPSGTAMTDEDLNRVIETIRNIHSK